MDCSDDLGVGEGLFDRGGPLLGHLLYVCCTFKKLTHESNIVQLGMF